MNATFPKITRFVRSAKSFLTLCAGVLIAGIIMGGFLSGCSNLFDNLTAEVKADPASGKDSGAYISFGKTNARSAIPSVASSDYTLLELTGRNRSDGEGAYVMLGSWNSYDQMMSSRIPISTGTWDFTLGAMCGGAVLSCDIDGFEVKLGTNTINFQLSVVSWSTEGSGNLSFAITYPSSPVTIVKSQFLEPGTLAPISDEEEMSVTYGSGTNTAILIKNQMASGSYVLRVVFYSQGGLKLNTYSEVVIISDNLNTSANRRLTSLNEIYSIRYELNGGTFAAAGTIPSSYTRKTSVILPDGTAVSRSPYIFAGWYDNPSYQGVPVRTIKKGTAGNVVLYAKWVDSENQVVESDQSVTTDTQTRISCPDLLQMTLANSTKKITASLVNYRGTKADDFTFAIDDETVAVIEAQSANGVAFISPVSKGFTEITVNHVQSGVSKKVLVFVAENDAELSETLTSTVFFTTSDNVLTINKLNDRKTLKLTANNLSEYERSNISWSCADGTKATVIGNGVTATVISLAWGKTEVTASHPASSNALTFHVYITDQNVSVSPQDNPSGGESGGNPPVDYAGEILGIKVMTPYYLVSSLPSGVTHATDGWTQDAQQPDEDRKYLWSYTHIVYSDNSYTDTPPCVIGTYGRNGESGTPGSGGEAGLNGVNGVGISSMKAYYLISSSMTSVTRATEGWSEIPVVPTESLKYLWSYTKVIYTDGTYTETEPCIIGTWSASGINGSTGTGGDPATVAKYVTASRNYYSLQSGSVVTVSVSTGGISAYDYSNISWSSSDESVAEILSRNGISVGIRAKAAGTAVLEASYPGCDAKATITVDVAEISGKNVYISASSEVMQLTSGGQTALLQAVLVNSNTQDPRGFAFEIDNTSVAGIVTQTENGYCYIKPVAAGQAQVTITNPEAEFSKKVIVTVANSEEELADMLYLTTSSNVVTIGEGTTKSISVSVRNSKDVILNGYTWSSSNPTVVSVTGNDSSALLTGNGTGTAVITVRQNSCTYPLNIIVQCVDPRAASANPYIQLSASVINLSADGTYTNITADLVGGDSSDFSGFSWSSNDSAICTVYGQNEVGKLKAVSAGTTYITVSHAKASYPAQILVICDEPVQNECYISVPSSIINMKPTDGTKTITASLINGGQSDKYSFSWSLDVYDIVDFQYSANVCTITPKQAGTVTVTISHPKAAFDQQIIVNVQQYSNFAFPGDYVNITEGTVQFLSMEVPASNISTYVRYYLKNDNDAQIVSITGTKNVAQITGVGEGSCTVYADLIATSNGTVQATDDLLVYVKPKPTESVYITSSNTINTIQRGKSQTISAYLTGTGVTQADQYELRWTTSDTDIITIGGLGADGSVKGNSIYVTAKNISSQEAREAIITCTHDKAPSALQFYVFVPGAQSKYISINKAVVQLTKGSSGTSLSATIDNCESREDYVDLKWSAETTEGTGDIVRILGSGQTVQIYPVNVGECIIKAELNGAKNFGQCNVIVKAPNSFAFEDAGTTLVVNPAYGSFALNNGNKKTRKFSFSPVDAVLTFSAQQNGGEYFSYSYTLDKDNNGNLTGTGTLEVTGLNVGLGNIACVTDANARSQITINVNYDKSFDTNVPNSITIEPVPANSVGKSYSYQVRPADKSIMEVRAEVLTSGVASDFVQIIEKSAGDGVITINPHKEYSSPVKVKFYAYDKKQKINVGEKTATFICQYAEITPKLTYKNKVGRFSVMNGNDVILGDGESLSLDMSVNEPGALYDFSSVIFVPNNNASKAYGNVTSSFNSTSKVLTVTSDTDTQRMVYLITDSYYPVRPDGTVVTDFKGKIKWFNDVSRNKLSFNLLEWSYWYGYALGLLDLGYTTGISGNEGTYKIDLLGESSNDKQFTNLNTCVFYKYYEIAGDDTNHLTKEMYSRVKNNSEIGKYYEIEEFKNIDWYYCPGLKTTGLEYPEGIMTSNVSATLTPTTSTDCIAYFLIGTVQYKLNHNGHLQFINGKDYGEFNVYLKVRYCTAN